MEIIGLIIRRGILLGTEQQAVPQEEINQISNNKPQEWYVIGYSTTKEDTDVDTSSLDEDVEVDEDVRYQYFSSKMEAMAVWKQTQALVNRKKGRAAVLVDCRKFKILRKTGESDTTDSCIEKVTKKGFLPPIQDDTESFIGVILKMYRSILSKQDIVLFIIVTLIKMLIEYSVVHRQFIKGNILAILVSDQTENLKNNTYVQLTCSSSFPCNDNISLGKALLLAGCMFKVFEILLGLVTIYITENLDSARKLDMQKQTLKHVMTLDQSYRDTHASVYSAMNSDSVYYLYKFRIPRLINLIYRLFLTLAYLLVIDFFLGGICVCVTTLFYVGLVRRFFKKQQTSRKFEWKWSSSLRETKYNMIDYSSLVKMFSNEDRHIREYDTIQGECVNSFQSLTFDRCLYSIASGLSGFAIFVGSVYVCLVHLRDSSLSAADVTSFFFLLQQFSENLMELFDQDDWMRTSLQDLNRFIELRNETPKMKNGEKQIEDLQGDIEMKDVSFVYPSRPCEVVLNKFNISIKAHKMTAIVGNSGSGKDFGCYERSDA